MALAAVPSLDELIKNTKLAEDLPCHVAQVLLHQVALILTPALVLRVQEAEQESLTKSEILSKEYLTVEQTCVLYHVTKKWLYRHKSRLPHIQPSRKRLLFPKDDLERWFARQRP